MARILIVGGGVIGSAIAYFLVANPDFQGEVLSFLRHGPKLAGAQLSDGESLSFDLAIDAGGPWAASIAQMAGIDLPVRARRRCVFVFSCKDEIPDCPLVIDPGGLWFRPEGPMFICGCPPAVDLDDLPLEVDYGLWDDTVWPQLANRVKSFEAIKLQNAWAGYYEFNIFDQNAILGRIRIAPIYISPTALVVMGFNRPQQWGVDLRNCWSTAATGRWTLSELGFDRIIANKPLVELNII